MKGFIQGIAFSSSRIGRVSLPGSPRRTASSTDLAPSSRLYPQASFVAPAARAIRESSVRRSVARQENFSSNAAPYSSRNEAITQGTPMCSAVARARSGFR